MSTCPTCGYTLNGGEPWLRDELMAEHRKDHDPPESVTAAPAESVPESDETGTG